MSAVTPAGPLAFPRRRAPPPSPQLPGTGIALRPAETADLPFLLGLYVGFRAPELLFAPWSAAQKQAFVEDQFRLQHLHFTRHFAAADFWILVEARPPAAPRPIGRLYLDRSGPAWRIVDIGLLPEARGRGTGRALIEWVQAESAAAGAKAVALHVATNNPGARALYLRLGFATSGPIEAHHEPMEWRPG